MTTDEQMITTVLSQYQSTVNRSDAVAVAALFTPDAVLMAENSPSSVGADAIHQAYAGIFEAIALNITFSVAEVRQVAPDWAFLRSTSAGTIRIKTAGADIPEANQELFIFQKIDATWKIARYSFSTTLAVRS
jgi:uncharacterized protein (TIGR02246 family)